MLQGSIPQSKGFNSVQVKHEQFKQDFIASNPELQGPIHALEDHELLWGRLTLFDMNDELFAKRIKSFISLFMEPCEDPEIFLLIKELSFRLEITPKMNLLTESNLETQKLLLGVVC